MKKADPKIAFVFRHWLDQLRDFSNPYPHSNSSFNQQQRPASEPQRDLSGCILITGQHTLHHQQRSRGERIILDSRRLLREQWSDTNSHAKAETNDYANGDTAGDRSSNRNNKGYPQANRDSNSHPQNSGDNFTERISPRDGMNRRRELRHGN